MNALSAQLATHGYEAFHIDDVAEAADVNRATIYRRWPTKADLVAALLRHLVDGIEQLPDTGSLEGDLEGGFEQITKRAAAPGKRALMRIITMHVSEPKIQNMVDTLRAESMDRWARAVRRAIARGELPKTTDVDLFIEVLTGPVHSRFLRSDQTIPRDLWRKVIDLVIAGARAHGSR